MAYTGITRLRLNMVHGSISEGSGEVVSKRAAEGTSYGGCSAEDLRGITPYANYGDFIEDTKSARYKGSHLDPRGAEEFEKRALREAIGGYEFGKRAAPLTRSDARDVSKEHARSPQRSRQKFRAGCIWGPSWESDCESSPGAPSHAPL